MFSSYQRTHNHIPHPPLSHVAILSSPSPPPSLPTSNHHAAFSLPCPPCGCPVGQCSSFWGKSSRRSQPRKDVCLPCLCCMTDPGPSMAIILLTAFRNHASIHQGPIIPMRSRPSVKPSRPKIAVSPMLAHHKIKRVSINCSVHAL